MNRLVRQLAVLLCLCCTLPAVAIDLEPIPAGADLVLFVNNHSSLPLGTLLDVVPVPPPVRQKINDFVAATEFNPLKNITRVQVMVKKGPSKPEDHAAIVLTGTFNKEKIVGFLAKVAGPATEEEKVGDVTLIKSKDGKGCLCFLDATRVVLGTIPAVRTFLEAKGGANLSQDYEALKPLVADKAYVALMIAGKEVLQKEFAKNQERRQRRMDRPGRGPDKGRDWLESYLFDGVQPTGVFAQVLDSKVEVKILYARGRNASNAIHGTVEINDPLLTIEAIFNAFLKVAPTLAPTNPKAQEEKPKEPAPSAQKGW